MSAPEDGYSRSHFYGLAGTEGKRGFGLAVLMPGDDWAEWRDGIAHVAYRDQDILGYTLTVAERDVSDPGVPRGLSGKGFALKCGESSAYQDAIS
jgi:hypothetical protein